MKNNKKTILYLITQGELGGAQIYVFNLAKNLRDEFNIIIAFGEQGKNGWLTKQLSEINIEYYTIPHLKRSISPFKDFLALLEIIKLIKKIKPDIIHLNSSKISILGSIAGFISKFKAQNPKPKIFYTVHGWVFNEPLSIFKKIFYKSTEKLTAKFKTKLICVSEYDKKIALKEKITSLKKIITIHNGIKKINFLTKEDAKQKIRKTCNANANFSMTDKLLIGSIGNLYKTKGFQYFILAIKKLLISNPQLLAIIIGEGAERKKIEKIIAQHKMQKNIILTGSIDDASTLLPAFDIYVCSSIKEGLSLTIIEAMQAGLPIVATNVGGNPELIEDNKTGLLVESKNPQQIADKIKEIIDNNELRIKISENARKRALKEFTLEEMTEKTKNIYLN